MKKISPSDAHPDFQGDIARLAGGDEYAAVHLARYLHTLRHMPTRSAFSSAATSVLEIGTSFVFPDILLGRFGFDHVDVTHFDDSLGKGSQEIHLERDTRFNVLTGFNVNLEHERVPVADGKYDMVICMEVIEHLELDPMFMLFEINRILKPGGLLYMSTPNVISARNVFKILKGYAPHFFMKYSRERTYYRHNIEYAPNQLLSMTNAAGFSTRKFWTEDCFEESMPDTIKFLQRTGHDVEHRGDNMFYIGAKSSLPVTRFPDDIYY